MSTLYTTIGPLRLQSYTLFLATGIGAGAALSLVYYRAKGAAGRQADAALGALAGAAVLARAFHVLFNLAYFRQQPDEIWRLGAGGLDWHGAVLGGLAGLLAVSRWRRLSAARLLDAFTPGLPLVALAAWAGCRAAACAYGAEVATLADHPAVVVSEAPDVFGIVAPRYDTPLFGMALSAVIFVIAVRLMRVEPLRDVRFWLVLALLSGMMFAIGFLRGDAAARVYGLRLDQWLDEALLALALMAIALTRRGRAARRPQTLTTT